MVGNAGSGKSTVGARLAEVLDAAFVELDALNWEPGWVAVHDADPQELDRRFRAATRGERWIVAGSYLSHSRRTFWERLETVIWLDLPMPLLLWRVLRRTWQRSRSRELLWGTNYESSPAVRREASGSDHRLRALMAVAPQDRATRTDGPRPAGPGANSREPAAPHSPKPPVSCSKRPCPLPARVSPQAGTA